MTTEKFPVPTGIPASGDDYGPARLAMKRAAKLIDPQVSNPVYERAIVDLIIELAPNGAEIDRELLREDLYQMALRAHDPDLYWTRRLKGVHRMFTAPNGDKLALTDEGWVVHIGALHDMIPSRAKHGFWEPMDSGSR